MIDDAALDAAGETWRREGWALIPGLVPTEEIDAAVEELRAIYPEPADLYAGREPAAAQPAGPAFRPEQFSGMTAFPFPGAGRLNRLLLHPNLLAFARKALGQADARLPDPVEPAQAPALYAAEVPAAGPRGSYLACRPDVWHRGVDLTGASASRFVMAAGFKPPGLDWIGYSPIQQSAPNYDFQQLVAGSTPDELAVLGIPRPGHPLWTEDLISSFAALYPGLDVAPWRQALLELRP